jgi:hypothetical protein
MNKLHNFDALKAAASATFAMFITTAAAMFFYASYKLQFTFTQGCTKLTNFARPLR